MQAESSKTGMQLRSRKRPKSELTSILNTLAAEPEDEAEPKGAKEKRRVKRGKVGKLAGLLNIPMDVLFEIFGHLRPLDLLNIARMTKQFRRVLMHRSSISVWKEARANVPGLPDCPPEMAEPHWANLAFYQHCNFCPTIVRNVEWRFRMRICPKCAATRLFNGPFSALCSIDPDWYKAIDSSPPAVYYKDLIPSRSGKRSRYICLIDDYRAVRAQYLSIPDAETRKAFLKERKDVVRQIIEHAVLCERWADGLVQDRSQVLQDKRELRKQAIIERLTALGWGDEIEKMIEPHNFADFKLVKQPQLLTDRVWKNISGGMIEFMEEVKTKRLAREHGALVIERKTPAINVLRQYKNSRLPCTEIMPESVDFCDFPPVKAVLEQPADTRVDESSFGHIIPLLPDLIKDWQVSINRMLIRAMSTNPIEEAIKELWADEEIDEDIHSDILIANEDRLAEKLKLATTVFKCFTCTLPDEWGPWLDADPDLESDFGFLSPTVEPLFYPKVLGHRCLTRVTEHPWVEYSPDSSRSFHHSITQRKKWACKSSLGLDKPTAKVVEEIVSVVGLDPRTATADDMDWLDTRVGCLSCLKPREKGGIITAYGWRSAVQHYNEEHDGNVARWCKLTPDQIKNAREIEKRVAAKMAAYDPSTVPWDTVAWLCAHCRDLPSEQPPTVLDLIEAHVKETHDISEPKLNEDYFKDFAAPQLYEAEIMPQMSCVSIG